MMATRQHIVDAFEGSACGIALWFFQQGNDDQRAAVQLDAHRFVALNRRPFFYIPLADTVEETGPVLIEPGVEGLTELLNILNRCEF